ncbi:hypothetical protein HAX54_005936 [Datura stramonium]|uniref:Aminotransferase-like plant mobile domain-containing protein n=1 Tax=Datura stramonium TaxID=4076 RepID=A0ABS8TAX5_DATST|nr:hypothetical protein [Datura stramonium]
MMTMIEQWRPETYIFHLHIDEVTIMVKDIEVRTMDRWTIIIHMSHCTIDQGTRMAEVPMIYLDIVEEPASGCVMTHLSLWRSKSRILYLRLGAQWKVLMEW